MATDADDAFDLERGGESAEAAGPAVGQAASMLNSSSSMNINPTSSPDDFDTWDTGTGINTDEDLFTKSAAGIEVSEDGIYLVQAVLAGTSAQSNDLQCAAQISVNTTAEGPVAIANPCNWRTDELSDVSARTEYAGLTVTHIVDASETDVLGVKVVRLRDVGNILANDAECELHVIRLGGIGGGEGGGGEGGGGGGR